MAGLIARSLGPRRVSTLDKVRRRRAIAVGRGALLGLAHVGGVVYARLTDHDPSGGRRAWLPEGHALLEVWGGDRIAVWRAVVDHQPAGVSLALVVRAARWWHHVFAWGRIVWWRVRRWRDRRGKR